jgi:molecular chaperone GrpE
MREQLEGLLQQHHCQRIEALHAPFDPNLHHAIMQQPSDDLPPNTVVQVAQEGYQLHDRVVRPSQVIVSAAK